MKKQKINKKKENCYTEEEIRELWFEDNSPPYFRDVTVGENEELSIDFIREFKDKIDWHNVSCWQHLSEKQIEEFKDQLDWWYISKKQNYSLSFIEKWKEKLDWFWVVLRKKKDKKFMDKYRDIIIGKFGNE